jgi:hypothetical protein
MIIDSARKRSDLLEQNEKEQIRTEPEQNETIEPLKFFIFQLTQLQFYIRSRQLVEYLIDLDEKRIHSFHNNTSYFLYC